MIKRGPFDWGIFLLLTAGLILLYIFISKVAAIILVGFAIILLFFLQYLRHTDLGLLVRYPKTYKTLKKYAQVREEQLIKLFNRPQMQIHRILYHFSKVWTYSPLVYLVRNSYISLNEKLMTLVIKDIKAYHEHQIPRDTLVKRIKNRISFKTNEEIDTLIKEMDKKLR